MTGRALTFRRLLAALLCLVSGALARPAAAADAGVSAHLAELEGAVAANPESLKVAADYRQVGVASGQFDRAIQFLEKLAKRKGSGPFVQISLALAYVDKVPSAGDIRRLYLGRDAIGALTRSIDQHPTALAYYVRGLINLYYNNFIFHRTDKGVADLLHAASMVRDDTPPALVARVYAALGDGYTRLGDLAKAREAWSVGLSRCPGDVALRTRMEKDGHELEVVVTTALSAGRRVDTSLIDLLPVS